jgi:phosphatidylglycerophosphate synthase
MKRTGVSGGMDISDRMKRFLPYPCSAQELPVYLARWSFIHALALLPAVAISLFTHTLTLFLLIGALSFLLLFLIVGPNWTRKGAFGFGNAMTALRLAGILALPSVCSRIGSVSVTGFGIVLLVADGLDGWLARRFNQASEFGEYFDKETDAFFLMLLCLLAFLNQRLGSWILIPGLLRYVFVIVTGFSMPSLLKEEKTDRARKIYVLMMAGVFSAFLPYPAFYRPLAGIATIALFWSFATDFIRVFKK